MSCYADDAACAWCGRPAGATAEAQALPVPVLCPSCAARQDEARDFA